MILSNPLAIEHLRRHRNSRCLIEFVARLRRNRLNSHGSSVAIYFSSIKGSRESSPDFASSSCGWGGENMLKKLFRCANFFAIFVLLAIQVHAQVPGPLKLAQTIPLPGLKDGDFDHFALDSAGQRLFLAA